AGDNAVAPEPNHEQRDEEGRRQIEPDIGDQHDVDQRRDDDLQHPHQRAAFDEGLRAVRARLHGLADQDRDARYQQYEADIEGEIAGFRPVAAPPGAQLVVADHGGGGKDDDRQRRYYLHRPDGDHASSVLA